MLLNKFINKLIYNYIPTDIILSTFKINKIIPFIFNNLLIIIEVHSHIPRHQKYSEENRPFCILHQHI